MADRALFQRILPAGMVADLLVYNLSVVGLSVLAGLLSFGLLALLAMLAAYGASKKLKAGIAGMSILLLSMLSAGLLSLAVSIVLLVTNLRFAR